MKALLFAVTTAIRLRDDGDYDFYGDNSLDKSLDNIDKQEPKPDYKLPELKQQPASVSN